MKGLLLNNFYSAIGNMKLFLVIVAIMGAALLYTGSPTFQELFVYITITALSINGVVGMRKEAASKWSRYEVAMPVRRGEIVKCKYIAYLSWVAIGTVLALAVTGIAVAFHSSGDLFIDTGGFLSMFVLGIGISFFSGAIFFPLSCLLGPEKSETVLLISVLAAIGFSIGILNVLNGLTGDFYVRTGIFLILYLAFYGLSYFITFGIYRRKEF